MAAKRLGLGAIILSVLLLLAALMSGRGAFASVGGAIGVESGAWVRLPVVAGRPGAGYLVLRGGAKDDRLVKVTSPLAGRIELHTMSMEGGIMRMAQVDGYALPGGGLLTLAPGGNHLMLFDLKAGAKPGAKIPLTLAFASGAKLELMAEGRSATDRASDKPAGHAHH
ncbi:copper chaperone PCu(A)C [Sandaracinobacteroides saxicola]|uniref:Copper chaperone PCu(A)C n=1 Tax=Sandaracinobacteroides saxicola TaxID=2759707 RepID=A0A7G5IGP8_9SPHN|nr:copper chaperone PCu(A)C [Sandaracinobacteroides saxicola]QMW22540.1 copper chaperone PCu(A)C [Sandaracinobacteroides saxicola]